MLSSLPTFRRRLLAWYDRHYRELPWRLPPGSRGPLDPYHVLVSELMLQQTQVATVIPYFRRFLERFPTLAALAQADSQEVLRLWQGLGYYSRARNLHETARRVLRDHAGHLPPDPADLLKLPGIGRYTAGAVASLAFGRRAPILDGNVARVFCRLDQIETDPRTPPTQALLWRRAEELLPRQRLGDFNSALMELGALICTPRSPQCLLCPVRSHCQAFAAGLQEKIPAPRKTKPTPLFHRWVFCIEHDGRWLIEQRPPRGRWAGLWQFITLEAGNATPDATLIRRHCALRTTPPRLIGRVAHTLTHRRYDFEVFTCTCHSGMSKAGSAHPARRWVALKNLSDYPLPRPHLKIAEILKML